MASSWLSIMHVTKDWKQTHGPRGAHTAHNGTPIGVQQHVAGLQVAVDDGRRLVQVRHCVGHVCRHLQQLRSPCQAVDISMASTHMSGLALS